MHKSSLVIYWVFSYFSSYIIFITSKNKLISVFTVKKNRYGNGSVIHNVIETSFSSYVIVPLFHFEQETE